MSDEPSKTTSEEADQKHLELSREAGDTYQRSLQHMTDEVAHTGGTTQAGDYIVGYAQEKAEGLYVPKDGGQLQWVEPTDENCHLEISVSDAADQRFVPNLTIRATLTAADGEEVGPFEVPFIWHPGLYHYGRNLTVPGDGTYTLSVEIDPPEFNRHDEKNGDRYAEAVEVTFENVDIKTGQG